jgi:hypothetical protein
MDRESMKTLLLGTGKEVYLLWRKNHLGVYETHGYRGISMLKDGATL